MMQWIVFMISGGGFVAFLGKINLKTVLAVGCIYLCAIALIIYSLVDSYLLAKDEFLFPSFSFSSAQRTLLIVLVSLFIIMSVLAVFLIFKKTCKTDKIAIPRVVNWIAFVVSSVGVVLAGVFLALAMSFACVSQTTDMDNYLTFDPCIDQKSVSEMFPSTEDIAFYVASGADISYKYRMKLGMLDAESTYSVTLEVDGIDTEHYQTVKNNLLQSYSEVSNDDWRITIEDSSQTDNDGYVFTLIRYIEFDDEACSIVYYAEQQY